MTLVPEILLLAFTGIILLLAIRNANRTFRRIYLDQSREPPSPRKLLGILAWNYFAAILTFAQLYRVLFTLDPGSFTVALQPFDGIYLSIVTISGTGYGDILPKSIEAKVAVCIEIVFGYFLTVILFSSFAGLAFRRRTDAITGKESDHSA
jgi:hypothetical protein